MKKVRFSKKVKVIMIDNNNNGTPVNNEKSTILDDLSKPRKFKGTSYAKNFLNKLKIQYIENPIVFKNNTVFIGNTLNVIKQDNKIIVVVNIKHNNHSDFLVFNPKFHSIEWLSHTTTNKDLLKKLREIFRTIGYKLIAPIVFPNIETMLLFIQSKSKSASLMSNSFYAQFIKMNKKEFDKHIANIKLNL